MVDYYVDREFLTPCSTSFTSVRLPRSGGIGGGVEQGFGSWYFNSVSAGWSPAYEEVRAAATGACGTDPLLRRALRLL